MKILRNKISNLLFVFLIVAGITLLTSCDKNSEQINSKTINIQDVVGGQFSFEKPLEKVVATQNPILNHIIILGDGSSKYLAGFGKKDLAYKLYGKILPDWDSIISIGDNTGQLNKETVINLNPQLALIPESTQQSREKDFEGTGIKTFVAMPKDESFDTIKSSLFLISKLFGEEQRAKEVSEKFDTIINEVKSLRANITDKPKVAFMGSSKYSLTTSNMIQAKMIEIAGGTNISFPQATNKFINIEPETLTAQNPDFIFIPSYASYTANDILNDEKLSNISAIKNNNVYDFPSNLDPWDWNTCSSSLGCAWILNKLHPELYSKERLISNCIDYYKFLYNYDFKKEDFEID